MKKTIFIAGVHGVGKTYYTTLLTSKNNKFERITASTLIRKEKDFENNTKQVQDIDDNQRILINNFLLARDKSDKIFLFDGHFVLTDKNGKVNDIGSYVFESLRLDEIILFIDDIQTIYSRLKDRDKISDLDINILAEIQDREVLAATKIQKILKIPLNIIDLKNKDENAVLKELEQIIQKY